MPKKIVPDKILNDRKTGSGNSVNEQLAEELHKPVVIKNSKEWNSMWDLNTIFGEQI